MGLEYHNEVKNSFHLKIIINIKKKKFCSSEIWTPDPWTKGQSCTHITSQPFWGYYFGGINNQVSLLFLDIPSELMWIMDGPLQRRLGKNAFIEAKHEKKEEEKSKITCVFFFNSVFFAFFLIQWRAH